MAKDNGATKEQQAAVSAWAKAQADYEQAQAKADAARNAAQSYAKTLYEAFGSEPFSVKSLGRKYRAVFRKETAQKDRKTGQLTGKMLPPSWSVIPIAENAPTREFS